MLAAADIQHCSIARMHYAIQHHSITNAQQLHKNSNSALPGALPLLSCIQTWHGAGESCCRICLQVEAYLEPPREAEKSSLLNMAIDPVTTALALLRACGRGKQLKQNTCAYRHLCYRKYSRNGLGCCCNDRNKRMPS